MLKAIPNVVASYVAGEFAIETDWFHTQLKSQKSLKVYIYLHPLFPEGIPSLQHEQQKSILNFFGKNN